MPLLYPLSQVPESIRKHLAPFQKQGVEFVLKKEGRAMIADEMGLGKTIQVCVPLRGLLLSDKKQYAEVQFACVYLWNNASSCVEDANGICFV